MGASTIRSERDRRGVLTITIDNPQRRNAFDERMLMRLGELFTRDCLDEQVRVVLISGAGEHFCAGFDLRSRPELDAEAGMRMTTEAFAALAIVPVPTVAVVRGAASGGGLGLVAACDLALADADARFASPEGRHGIMPAVILPHLARAVGRRRAYSLMVSGRFIDADTARVWGLVDEIAEMGELDAAAERLIAALLAVAPASQRRAMFFLREIESLSEPQLIDRCIEEATASRVSTDAREGVVAFREKRPPRWVAQP